MSYFQQRYNRGDFEERPGTGHIQKLQKDVDEVKNVMTQNIGV